MEKGAGKKIDAGSPGRVDVFGRGTQDPAHVAPGGGSIYTYTPTPGTGTPGSPEEEILKIFKNPRDWV